MDLHALGQGRSALVTRGVIAFLFGVVASNMPEGVSADTLLTLLGVWALAEGAATIRQGYPRVAKTGRPEAQPAVVAVGGLAVVVGVLAGAGPRVRPAPPCSGCWPAGWPSGLPPSSSPASPPAPRGPAS